MKKRKILYNIHPIQKVLFSFLALILTGGFLLWLPFSNTNGISFINAVFTSTSAVCVTGLVAADTAKDFTFLGQVIIMLLIQFGGLGIMTFSIGLALLMGSEFSLKWRITMESIYSDLKTIPAISIMKRIVIYTFNIELAIAILLFTQFITDHGPLEAAWHAIFHSVSAFCNAGFSTFSDNIAGYKENTIVMAAISLAIILGGLGFIVLTEIANINFRKPRRIFRNFSMHTRIVLVTTFVLLAGGTVLVSLTEWNVTLKNLSPWYSVMNAFFQSASCRTAGFNSVDIGAMRSTTLFVMIWLMFIGGSPGSIAGGIKTTTAATIYGFLSSKIRGEQQTVFWGRAVDPGSIEKSMTLTMLAALFTCVSAFGLLTIGSFHLETSFIDALYEVVSAFNTVGLSTGITPKIPDGGKLLLCFVMYAGRLGPLTLITALTLRSKDPAIKHAEETVMIG